ncbi:unnamed protein product [Calicophoron daubneyi]|uniref:Major facilitator superfamily (MFS) profile domain-containing protein n=1 Tax=Calicophoron daubneyi TaxID=300641 RepID=A0AAV2TYH6_CALDB
MSSEGNLVRAVFVAFLTSLSAGICLGYRSYLIFARSWILEAEITFYAGLVCGSLLACWFMARCGRQWTMHFTCLLSLVGWSCFCASPRSGSGNCYLTGCFLLGTSVSLFIPACLVYLFEIVPCKWAATVGCLTWFGVTLGFTLSQALIAFPSWIRIAFINATIVTVVNIILWPLPESPKWLKKVEQFQMAAAASSWFYGLTPGDAADGRGSLSPQDAKSLLGAAPAQIPTLQYKSKFLVAMWLMLLQQLTGFGPMLYFGELIFKYEGFPVAYYLAPSIGLPQVVSTLIAILVANFAPRKAMLYYSAIIMTLAHFILGLLLTSDDLKPTSPFIILCITLYMIGFSLGWGPLPMVIIMELFGPAERDFPLGLTVSLSWLMHFFLIFSYEPITVVVPPSVYHWMTAGFCLFACFVVRQWIPETKDSDADEYVVKRAMNLELRGSAPSSSTNAFVPRPASSVDNKIA